MKSYKLSSMILAAFVVLAANAAMADIFGTGGNQFTIDFVNISGATNPTSSIPMGDGFMFTGVANDYRMGTYEITNNQWNKFEAGVGGTVTGSQGGYIYSFYDLGTGATNVPTNYVSWYEAAQFVNYLNTSTNHQAAYKFTGTQGTSDYTFAAWSVTDTGYDARNPYRNKAAKYFLPTENEWVKAAYWNGTTLQTYATKAGQTLFQGNGTNGGWNYYTTHHATSPYGSWNVGCGSQELNSTYEMMGNVWEWMESPYSSASGNYGASSSRGLRGGSWGGYSNGFAASNRYSYYAAGEGANLGFRVASVPEPSSIATLAGIALTALPYWWRKQAQAIV
jgi:formylglycine-generating enzyme required for sulfatase activity